jgi:hypothetical protein
MATLSPFLTLPLELRNQIYTLLLPSSKPIRLLQKHTDQPEEHYHSMYWKQKMLSLPILHTNKQISFEARKVLLERNIIVLRNDIFGLPSKEILETMKGVRKVKINLDKMEGAEEVVEWLVSVGRLDWL